jgi:hypothetical protein
MVQRAGFEPANRYGLGPHPSAFDQAGRPLQQSKRLHSRISTHSLLLQKKSVQHVIEPSASLI